MSSLVDSMIDSSRVRETDRTRVFARCRSRSLTHDGGRIMMQAIHVDCGITRCSRAISTLPAARCASTRNSSVKPSMRVLAPYAPLLLLLLTHSYANTRDSISLSFSDVDQLNATKSFHLTSESIHVIDKLGNEVSLAFSLDSNARSLIAARHFAHHVVVIHHCVVHVLGLSEGVHDGVSAGQCMTPSPRCCFLAS